MSADHAAGEQTPLTDRVEAGLARLDAEPLAAHPGLFEAMDAQIRAALRALDGT